MKKYIYLLAFAASLCLTSCEKEQSMTQLDVKLLQSTFFPPRQLVVAGSIKTSGFTPNPTDIRYGVTLAPYSNPTIHDTYWYFDGTVESDENRWPHDGTFTMCFSDQFVPGNTYYVRAMATTESETSVVYGNEYSFSVPRNIPTMDTILYVDNITSNSAKVTFTVKETGGYTITEYGVRWAYTADMTTSSRRYYTKSPELNKPQTITLSNLKAGTRYEIRAYATNGSGTAYSDGYYFITSK